MNPPTLILPLSLWAVAILAAFAITEFLKLLLDHLNLAHMQAKGPVVPPEFSGLIDEDAMKKSLDYARVRTRFGLIGGIFDALLAAAFYFGGILATYDAWVRDLHISFIASGIVFFVLLSYAETLLNIPFALYNTFVIENRYGFNKTTPGLWAADFLKSTLISTVLLCAAISAALWLIGWSPQRWWLWVWSFLFTFSIFMMYVSPYVIEPLFNKFTPLLDEKLDRDVKTLMQQAGIAVQRVFIMDASRRSGHTNAYFTGIGKTRRIVLFDTLIEKTSRGELLAVLAHEAGHWKKKHLFKTLAAFESASLVLFYAAFRLVDSEAPAAALGLHGPSFFARAIVLGLFVGIFSFYLSPLVNYFMRRHERQADDFAVRLTGDKESFKSALVKLSRDNLSNPYPHPLYAIFHYSHPPVLERLRRIGNG
jgi:STE24 endopeptidase